MKILQFAFEDEDSNYLPYNQPYNCVCYTGTHDNDTTTGWYATASEKARDKVRRYMNTDVRRLAGTSSAPVSVLLHVLRSFLFRIYSAREVTVA